MKYAPYSYEKRWKQAYIHAYKAKQDPLSFSFMTNFSIEYIYNKQYNFYK